MLLPLEGRNVKLSVSLLEFMGPFIIEQLHRQRIQFPFFHFFFFMTVVPRKGKNIITECRNTLTKKYRLLAYRRTLGVNCEAFLLLIMPSSPLS